MEDALTIKHPAKFVNVYIQDDQTSIAGQIAPPVFRYDEEKASHAKTGIVEGIPAGRPSSKNTALDRETAPFDLVVNFKRREGMAIANAATASQIG